MEIVKDWKEVLQIKEITNTDIVQIERIVYYVENLGENNRFVELEKLLYEYSNKALMTSAIANDNCELDFVKRILSHEYDVNVNMWGTASTESDLLDIAILYMNKALIEYFVKEREVKLSTHALKEALNDIGSIDDIKYLLEVGAISDEFKNTELLHFVIDEVNSSESEEGISFVKFLIDGGADISLNDYAVIKSMYTFSHLYEDVLKDLFIYTHKKLINKN